MGLRGALIADTMPPASLTAAMGIARTTSDTARIFGALTGAGMFAAIGIGPTYVAITAFYLLGAILTWNTSRAALGAGRGDAAAKRPRRKPSPWHELREGIVLVWNTPRLLAIVWYALLFNFAVFPLTNGLMPYAARDIFDTDQTGLGYLIASVAFGAFVGSIIMTRSGMRMELARIMIVAAVIWHILVLIFAQMTTLWAGIVMLMLCGFAQSLTMVCHTVILLSASSPRYRGRIMGVRMLAIYSLPVGLLVAGVLIGWIGFRATASLYAIVGLVFTILIAVKWRASLWQARTLPEGTGCAMPRRAAAKDAKTQAQVAAALGVVAGRAAAEAAAEGPQAAAAGHLAGRLPARAQRRAGGEGLRRSGRTAGLSSEWFSPERHAGHRHPVLSGASAPDAARAQDDHRRRGRHARRMHAHPAPRGRPRDAALLCAAPAPPLAAPVRPFIDPLSELLSARSGEPEFRPASPALVRAKPSGRGFRRDLRGLADAALELAQALRGLAGVEEAAIRGRADGGDRQAEAEADAADRGRAAALADARRSASTTRRSSSTIRSTRRAPTTAICCASSPTIRGTGIRRRPRPSSGTIAATSGGWFRNGPANISSRSTRCSTR